MAKSTQRGYKPAKNYEPGRGKSASKPGSKSPKHRGYKPEVEAPKKARWNADDRATRAARTDRTDRTDRTARADRTDRFAQADRPERADRARTGRSERPSRDRDMRPARGDRPSYDREARPARGDRPDWAPRAERAGQNSRSRRENPRHERVERRTSRYFDERGVERGGERGIERERGPRDDRGRSQRPRHDRDEQRFTPQDDIVLERLEAQAIEASDVQNVTFDELGLGKNIVRALADLGAKQPFPIQAATIPDVLSGRDVLGRGRTGSGKTIAFGAPLVERLLGLAASQPVAQDAREQKLVRGERAPKRRQQGRNPRALILAPTRELALQIDRTVQPIAQSVGLFTTQIYGGVPQTRQVGALQRGVDIVIGTPGRIEDLIEQGRLNLRDVQITVLDEADHMCDLGFLEPVQRILRQTVPGGQKLLFSATLDKGVASLVNEFLPEPSVHEVAGEDQASGTIEHRVLLVNREDKMDVIQQLVDRPGKVLVFSRTRAYAERLADELDDAGIPAVSLHGDLNQAKRTRNLEKLTKGRVNVLVATDVAARGIHVDDIDLVVQADPPDEYKTYLHRAGRTGRAGKRGMVVTLVPRTRQKKTKELLGRAEIDADIVTFYPGDSL